MTSNQIQLANIYDIDGNSLLLNEIVLSNQQYIFERISSSIHLLTEKTDMLPSGQMTNEFTEKCPSGPSGTQVDGPGLNGKLEWCELEKVEVLLKKTLVSTSKRVLLVKPESSGTKVNGLFSAANRLCGNMCGRLYFPSTLSEIKEIKRFARHNQWSEWWIWLRLRYDKRYWTWRDADKLKIIKFTNWGKDEPKSGTEYAAMTSDGKWYSSNFTTVWDPDAKWGMRHQLPTYSATHVLCELS